MFLWDTDLDFVTTAVSLVATIVSLTTIGSSFAIVSLTTTGTTGSSFAITATISLSIDFVEATEGRVRVLTGDSAEKPRFRKL
jgi:hypothetical protein